MGGLLVLLSARSRRDLEGSLRERAARSPWRGDLRSFSSDHVAIGVQARDDEAVLIHHDRFVVALNGYIRSVSAGGWSADRRSDSDELISALLPSGDVVRDLEALDGEFVLAVVDLRDALLYVARDHLGTKALFLARDAETAALASDAGQAAAGGRKSLSVSKSAIARYLANPGLAEGSLFDEVDSVAGGTGQVFRIGVPPSDGEPFVLWSAPALAQAQSDRHEDPLSGEEVRQALREAVAKSIPPVPYGVTVSGGVDSAFVWALCEELEDERCSGRKDSPHVYATEFPGYTCDEGPAVRSLTEGATPRRTLIDLSRSRPSAYSERLGVSLEAPQFPTAFVLHEIAAAASARGDKAILTGFLADQWFDHSPEVGPSPAGRAGWPSASKAWRKLRAEILTSLPARMRWQLRCRARYPWLNPGICTIRDEPDTRPSARTAMRNVPMETLLSRVRSEQVGLGFQVWEQIGERHGVQFRHPFASRGLLELLLTRKWRPASIGRDKPLLREAARLDLPERHLERKKVFFDAVLTNDEEFLSKQDPTEWLLVKRGILRRGGVNRTLRRARRGDRLTVALWLSLAEEFLRRFSPESPGTS